MLNEISTDRHTPFTINPQKLFQVILISTHLSAHSRRVSVPESASLVELIQISIYLESINWINLLSKFPPLQFFPSKSMSITFACSYDPINFPHWSTHSRLEVSVDDDDEAALGRGHSIFIRYLSIARYPPLQPSPPKKHAAKVREISMNNRNEWKTFPFPGTSPAKLYCDVRCLDVTRMVASSDVQSLPSPNQTPTRVCSPVGPNQYLANQSLRLIRWQTTRATRCGLLRWARICRYRGMLFID